jgi:hypothetical protein
LCPKPDNTPLKLAAAKGRSLAAKRYLPFQLDGIRKGISFEVSKVRVRKDCGDYRYDCG